ncbi:hypothetical protein AC579_3350, partial [Pseudocercospora musae]
DYWAQDSQKGHFQSIIAFTELYQPEVTRFTRLWHLARRCKCNATIREGIKYQIFGKTRSRSISLRQTGSRNAPSSPSINSLMPSSFAQTRTTPQNQVNSAIPPAIPPSPVYMFFQTDRSLLVYILVSRDDSTHRTSVPRVRIICAAMRRTPKINRWTHTGPESSMTPEERIAIALWRSMYGIQIIRNLMWLGGDM